MNMLTSNASWMPGVLALLGGALAGVSYVAFLLRRLR